jgi:hypothetical protein
MFLCATPKKSFLKVKQQIIRTVDMYFRKIFALAIVGLLCVSCVSTKEYEKKLTSWVGQSERSLIDSWGPPHRAYETGGTKYLTWSSSGSMTLPGQQPTYYTNVIGNTAYTNAVGGSAPTTINLNCETTFTIAGGIIQSWRWQGNNCR